MKKAKIRLAKCPCCQTERHRTEVKQVLSILDQRNEKLYKCLESWGLDSYAELFESDFYWACDFCLSTGTAVLSNMPSEQGTKTPHLVYFDTNFRCLNCGIECVFTISEKKAWFEQYQLRLDSHPNKCLKCRKEQRLRKEQNKRLSELLKKDVSTLTGEELDEAVAIYSEWEKVEKVALYQSILAKRYPGGRTLPS